ncbi:hypothetical protein C352_02043 [Cryptococcus neoformans CHC193]|nr:hypothetical protein C352_02043 [Cryptococcus neoformans var. grubii CHC193]
MREERLFLAANSVEGYLGIIMTMFGMHALHPPLPERGHGLGRKAESKKA